MMAEKLSKHDALNKLVEVEDLLPRLAGLREAVEVAVSLESNRVAIEKEHKIALDSLLTDKEKLKKLQDEIYKCGGKLKTRMEADDDVLNEAKIKNVERANEDRQKYASMEEKLKSEYEDNKKKHNVMIKEKEGIISQLEAKITKLERVYNEAKRLALAE